MLYDSLVDIAATAAEALGKAGPGPTGLALTRFRQLDARVVAIMDRIKTILS
jgi:hypothetical protein